MNLYHKYLFLKSNYWHMFAHKPLCEKYKNEVIKLKKVYFCRSCFFIYLGLFTGLFFQFKPVLYVVSLSLIGLFSTEVFYKLLNRKVRDLVRFLSGFLILNTLYFMMKLNIIGLYGTSIIFLVRHFYYEKRINRKLKECNGCVEVGRGEVCSGFIKQLPSMRKYENELTKLAYEKRGVEYDFE